MKQVARFVEITAATMLFCTAALAAGKYSGGAGDGIASATAPATGLGGAALSMTAPADQVIDRTRAAIPMGSRDCTISNAA